MANIVPDRFEVIVVGAGPAGTTTAFTLAEAGLKVVLFERAEEPGQKNMFGGVLHYSQALNELVPDFWEHAPVERYITKYETNFLNSDSLISFSFADKSFGRPPYNGVILFRRPKKQAFLWLPTQWWMILYGMVIKS